MVRLKIAKKANLSVPKVYGWNRHIIIQELIIGNDLVKVRDLADPIEVMNIILDFINKAWHQGEFVHGDLSEHNIIMRSQDDYPVIIDLPQAVDRLSKNSMELLERDIKNILTYFNRKYKIVSSYDEILNQILQGS